MMGDSVAEYQPPRVEGDDVMGGDPDLEGVDKVGRPTREELEDKVTLLQEENQDLKKSLERVRQMFRGEWNQREREWRGKEEELVTLKKKGASLLKTVDHSKKLLGQKATMVGLKLAEIQELTMKMNELKYGKVQRPVILGHMEQAIGQGDVVGRKDAVAVLPEEMWKMILGNVSNPSDLWNLCNTCQLFDKILSPWKTGWMLEQALPYLYQHLPANKLLESRLICKSWKRTVDHFLGNHPSLNPHDPEKHEPRKLDFVNPMKDKRIGRNYSFSMHNETDVSLFEDPAFIEKWKRTGIIGRSITLTLGDDEDIAEEFRRNDTVKQRFVDLWTKFYGFLNSFGPEVLCLNVMLTLSNTEGDPWEPKLRNFLTVDLFRLFPELRTLRVSYIDCDFQEVNPASLPPAPKLETFESESFGGGLTTAMLTRYHTQLRSLNITEGTWRDVSHLNWPNLTELNLNGFDSEACFENLFDGLRLPVQLPKLRKLGMHLEQLTGNRVEFQVLLGIIRELSASTPLNILRLGGGLRGFHIGQASKGSCYALSGIKTLEFHHYMEEYKGATPTYDFLLHFFPHLENLNVFVRSINNEGGFFGIEPVNDTEFGLLSQRKCRKLRRQLRPGKGQEILEVNKYIYDGQMYKSNIWELMPLLTVFTFQWDVYTRHEYEAYKGKLNGTGTM